MRLTFRILAFFSALFAFILLIVDGTSMIAARRWGFTGIGEVILRLFDPRIVERMLAAPSRLHPGLARALELLIMSLPALFVFVALALAFWRLGREKKFMDMPRRSD